MSYEDELATVVIDNGTAFVKAGFAGEEAPRHNIRSVVGRLRNRRMLQGMGVKDSYVGTEAQEKREALDIKYPIHRGEVTNWNDMETVWYHTFYNCLRVAPEEHPILQIISPLTNSPQNREKLAQVMFETFSPPACYAGTPSLLSLIASGRTTGTVLESGEGVTQSISVFEGYVVPDSHKLFKLNGFDITEFLSKSLKERGYSFETREEIEKIKETLGYIAGNYDEEMAKDPASVAGKYELPDGRCVTLEKERFQCGEVFFQPSLFGHDSVGLHEFLYGAIQECEIDARRDMYKNIVVSGGNTIFTGFSARLKSEMRKLAPSSFTARSFGMCQLDDRINNVWVGGSIIASLSTFQGMWISKEEYDEYGPSIIHTKCYPSL